jgi:electron transfer flavoprotein alpha subunit
MAGTMVVAELSDGTVRKSTLSAIAFARQVDTPFAILAMGAGATAAADQLTGYGAQTVVVVDDAVLKDPVCERYVPTIVAMVQQGGWDTVALAASAFGKDLAPRIAAQLGAGYAPDINGLKVEGGKRLYRVARDCDAPESGHGPSNRVRRCGAAPTRGRCEPYRYGPTSPGRPRGIAHRVRQTRGGHQRAA